MAVWQIMKNGVPLVDTSVAPSINLIFDDGNQLEPGDAAFTSTDVQSHVAGLGTAADGFNYMGASPTQAAT